MASTATSRLRLNKQGTYDNPETWGIELNNGMIDMVDEAVGGFSATISGDVSLTVENYTADQARKMFMILDGAGGFTITVPAVDKMYYVVNNCAADVTVKPLAGVGAVIRAGMAMWWYCDGTNGFVFDPTLDQILPPATNLDLNANKLINVGAPVDPDDAATKGYIDDLAALSDLGTVAAIAPEIVTVAHIQDGTVATDAVTDVAAVAGDIVLLAPKADDISQLAGMFTGASASDPTTRLDGSPLQAGDYYLNTSGTPTVRVYDGSNWIPIEAVAIASQGEAEAGSNNTKMMTPLRTKQAIDANHIEYGTIPLGSLLAPSNVAVVDITLPPGYDQYILKFWELLPSADNQKLWLRTSTDGGTSFDAGASDYSTISIRAGGTAIASVAETSAQIQLVSSGISTDQVGNAANEDGVFGSITIQNPATSKYTYIRSLTGYAIASNGLPAICDCFARRNSASDVDAIRIMFASGNIASGFIQLYGVVTK
jgi:hypothetical protein